MFELYQDPKNKKESVDVNSKIFTPADLDEFLHSKIVQYVKVWSWSKLESEIASMIDRSFESARRLAEDGHFDSDKLETAIKNTKPSRTYLRDYVNGRSICMRYTNAIALFFKVEYTISQHDPCADFLQKIKIFETGVVGTA